MDDDFEENESFEKTEPRKKTTKHQLEQMITFIEKNPILLVPVKGENSGKISQKNKILWTSFAKHMSKTDNGPYKTPEQWKKVFLDFKSNIKKKIRTINKAKMDNEESYLKLNSIENRWLKLYEQQQTGKLFIPDLNPNDVNQESEENFDDDYKEFKVDYEDNDESESTEHKSQSNYESYELRSRNNESKKDDIFQPQTKKAKTNHSEESSDTFVDAINRFTNVADKFFDSYEITLKMEKEKLLIKRREVDALEKISQYLDKISNEMEKRNLNHLQNMN